MKDGFDVVSDVIALLNVPELTTTIDGKIWPVLKPSERTNTDIVINTLFGDNEQIQIAVVNVNIHVANIGNLPNQSEFKRLSKLITDLLHNRYMPSFWTEVTIPGELFDNPDGTYFSRVQVKYQSIQDNYTNI